MKEMIPQDYHSTQALVAALTNYFVDNILDNIFERFSGL